MAIFANGGGDSINIFGHKVPLQLIAAIIAVVGVLVVLRARKNGQTVAAVGTPPVSSPGLGIDPGFGSTSFQPDVSGQLSNITSQLTSLTQGLNPPASTSPPLPPNPFQVLKGNTYFTVGGTEQQAAQAISAQFGGNVSDVIGRLDFFDPNGPINGLYYYPLNVPGYQPGDLPRWQQLVVK